MGGRIGEEHEVFEDLMERPVRLRACCSSRHHPGQTVENPQLFGVGLVLVRCTGSNRCNAAKERRRSAPQPGQSEKGDQSGRHHRVTQSSGAVGIAHAQDPSRYRLYSNTLCISMAGASKPVPDAGAAFEAREETRRRLREAAWTCSSSGASGRPPSRRSQPAPGSPAGPSTRTIRTRTPSSSTSWTNVSPSGSMASPR